MHKSKSLNKGLEHFARGEYAGAYEAGSHALVDPEAEAVIAHGIVGTSSLYLRERTDSPLPEMRKSPQPSPQSRVVSPRWQDSTTVGAIPRSPTETIEVSMKAPPALHPTRNLDSEAELARRQREAEKLRQQEEKLRREQEDRDRRRRDREANEAAQRAAEQERLNRDAELRARVRRETEDAEKRRAAKEIEEQLKRVTAERDGAVAEIHSLHAALLRNRDQTEATVRKLQQRNDDLTDALNKTQEELHTEKSRCHIEPEELERLKRELLAAKQALERQKNEHEAERKLLTNERDNAVAKLPALLTQIETLKLEVQRHTNAASLQRAEHEREISDINRRHNDEKAILERDFNQIKDANNEREELARDLAKVQGDREQQEAELRSLQRELEDVKRNLNSSDLDNRSLADQNNELQSQQKYLISDLQSEKDATQRIKGELSRQQQEHNRRLQDVKDQHEVVAEQHGRELKRLEDDLERQQGEHSTQLQAVRADLSAQLQKVTAVGKENLELKQQLKEKTATLDGLQGVSDKAAGLEDKLASQQAQHRDEKTQLENELNDVCQRYNELLELLEGWKDERNKFDTRTDMLVAKVKRPVSPSPSNSLPPSRCSSRLSGYSPDKYSLGGPSPTRSEAGASAL